MSHHCGPKVHLVCGFLGVGKTTALRALAAKRPPSERWAILVNEVGMIDVDGALLEVSDATLGVRIETLPGGCICCTTQAPFKEAVAETLRSTQVHRLFIEPTGLASPGPLLQALRAAPFHGQLEVGRVITLVDPRPFLEPAMRSHPVFSEQIALADVLIANRSDLVSESDMARFMEEAGAIRPEKAVIAATSFGQIELGWLDGEGTERVVHGSAHAHRERAQGARPSRGAPAPDADGVVRWAHSDDLASTCGWIFPPQERFVSEILRGVLLLLSTEGPLLPQGALRIKGLIRLEEGAVSVHASEDGVTLEPVPSCADSRLELIVRPGDDPPWGAVEAALVSATVPRIR